MQKCPRTARWRAVMIVPASIVAFLAFGSTSAFAASASPAAVSTVHGQGGNSATAPGQLAKADGGSAASAAPSSAGPAADVASPADHGKDAAPGQVKKADSSADAGAAGPTTAATTTAANPASSTTVAASTPGNSDHSQGNAGTSGSYNTPQPPSTADQNSGGANGDCLATSNPKGPYCSTRDGSASGNGNGNGKAVGKPCAGCVGKADNKNPKGQNPNGSDHNAGYECDRNHGIGRTNPAHTGCKTTPPCSTNCTPCPPNSPLGSACNPCPTGKVFNAATGTCDKPGCTVNCNPCPPNSALGSACNPCPSGTVFNPATGTCGSTQCTGVVCNPCPNGHSRDANGSCGGGCDASTSNCGGGGGCDATTTDCGGACLPGQTMNAAGECVPPTACPQGTTMHGRTCVPPTVCGSGVMNASTGTCVKGVKHTRQPTTTPTKVLGEKVTRTPEALPFTGADSAALTLLALFALMLGALLTAAGRRRRPALATAARSADHAGRAPATTDTRTLARRFARRGGDRPGRVTGPGDRFRPRSDR